MYFKKYLDFKLQEEAFLALLTKLKQQFEIIYDP
jgi:hypothetical protein